MNVSPATYEAPLMSDKKNTLHYMNFQFLKLDANYQRLMANEKLVAKQEFLASFDAVAERMPVATFALTGLRADCDLLLWRVSRHIKDLHAMTSRLQHSGFGKYLSTTRSLLGTVAGSGYELPPRPRGKHNAPPPVLGQAPYLIVRVMSNASPDSLPAASGFPSARIHVADCGGLDDHGLVTAFETADPLKHRKFAAACKGTPETATFLGIRASIREIVDSFG